MTTGYHLMSEKLNCSTKRPLFPRAYLTGDLMLNLCFKMLLGLPILLAAFSNTSAASEPPTLCEQFRQLLGTRSGLTPYALEAFPPDGWGEKRIPNLDVDGDGLSDEVRWFCPGSGSIIPADPCTLSIKLSSGTEIAFEESRFYLARYHSRIYAVAAQSGLNREIGIGKIYRIEKSGVKLVCSKL